MVNGTKIPSVLSYEEWNARMVVHDADTELVEAAQQGNLSAFEALVLKHQKRMLNIAFRLIDEHEEACEVVQDAFVAAFRNLKTFRGDARFTTWLTSITVNLSKNRLKQMRSRRGREAYSLDATVHIEDGEMNVDLPSKDLSALDSMEKNEIKVRVQNCIRALGPDFREVLVLRDMQDFSYEEISCALNVASGTVKSRLFRAREMVRDCLKKCMGEL